MEVARVAEVLAKVVLVDSREQEEVAVQAVVPWVHKVVEE